MQFFLSVTVLTSVYASLAAGFVIIYKSSRILNFAYASIVLLAGYSVVAAIELVTGPPVIAIAFVLVLCFVFGLVIYKLLMRPMAGQPPYAIIIMTVALGIVLEAVTILIWKGKIEYISLGWRAFLLLPGGVRISSTELIIMIGTTIFFGGLFSFFRYSKTGQQMRATAENIHLAARRGINIYYITGFAWGLAIFSTGLGAVILGSNYWINLDIGVLAVKAFAVAVLGGLDSIGGAIPAAFIIALVEMTVCSYLNPRLADAIPFVIMVIVLIVRPWGLFGTKEEIERI